MIDSLVPCCPSIIYCVKKDMLNWLLGRVLEHIGSRNNCRIAFCQYHVARRGCYDTAAFVQNCFFVAGLAAVGLRSCMMRREWADVLSELAKSTRQLASPGGPTSLPTSIQTDKRGIIHQDPC